MCLAILDPVKRNMIPGVSSTDLTCNYSFTINHQFNDGSRLLLLHFFPEINGFNYSKL